MELYFWGFGSGFGVALALWGWWYHGNAKPQLDAAKDILAHKLHGD